MLHKSHKYWFWWKTAIHAPKNTLVACLDIIHPSLQTVLVWKAFHSLMVPNYCRLCIHLKCKYNLFYYHNIHFRSIIWYCNRDSEIAASCVIYPLNLKRDSSATDYYFGTCIRISVMGPIHSALEPIMIMVHGSQRPIRKSIILNLFCKSTECKIFCLVNQ